ncbi:MAG: DUF6913 domain-containing protein [Bacteroidales bacterium]
MDLFKNIRLKRGRAILRRRIKDLKREKFKGNLASVKQIGIVWNASQVSDFEYLSQFHQKMQEKGIEVKILGFYSEKVLPDRLTAIRYLSCIKKKNDLNFFYIPVADEAEKFINTPFDVLIDINFKNLFPLQYVTAMSKASLKIGLFNKGYNSFLFDMMLDINKQANINDYLNNIVYYLEMINNPSEVKNQ